MTEPTAPARYNNSFFFSTHLTQNFICKVRPDANFDDLLKPGFWAHVADKLKPGHVIEVWPDDWSYVARLRVVEVGRLYARVALEHKAELLATGDDSAELRIEWGGPSVKYRVLRGKHELKGGFAEKRNAQKWIDEEYKPQPKAA